MSTQRHNTAIARAMEFTAHDLAQNRRGDLSPLQHQKLAVMRDMFIDDLNAVPPLHIPSIVRLIVIGLVMGILYVFGVFDRLQQGLDAWYRPLLLGSSLLLLGSFLWTQFRYAAVRVWLPDVLYQSFSRIACRIVCQKPCNHVYKSNGNKVLIN